MTDMFSTRTCGVALEIVRADLPDHDPGALRAGKARPSAKGSLRLTLECATHRSRVGIGERDPPLAALLHAACVMW